MMRDYVRDGEAAGVIKVSQTCYVKDDNECQLSVIE